MEEKTKEVLRVLHKHSLKNTVKILKTLPKIVMNKLYPKDMEDLYISITKKQGMYLYNTILAHKCKNIVEFGTSFGISSIYLASAAKQNQGHVTTTEILSSKCSIARENFQQANLSQYINLIEGDARETLKNIDTDIDFVFMDGWKVLYLPVIKLLEPKLKKGCIIIADNVDFANTKPYLRYVKNNKSYTSEYVKQFGRTTEKSIWLGEEK